MLYRIDPASGRVRSVDLGGHVVRPVYGMGFVWLCADTEDAEMMRVDPQTLRAEFAGKGLPEEGGEYAAGLGSVWRLDLASGTLMRFDPKTRDLSGLVHVFEGGAAQSGLEVTRSSQATARSGSRRVAPQPALSPGSAHRVTFGRTWQPKGSGKCA